MVEGKAMSTVSLPDEQWSKIHEFLHSCPRVYVGQETDYHRFVEAVLWMARSGAQWRLLPTAYGHWNSIYKRFARWCEAGIWERMHHHFIQEPDFEWLVLDSTIIRAHPCAAGAPQVKGGKRSKRWDAVKPVSAPRFI